MGKWRVMRQRWERETGRNIDIFEEESLKEGKKRFEDRNAQRKKERLKQRWRLKERKKEILT
jgi:hypothetical protein